jgi:hypothetical protein
MTSNFANRYHGTTYKGYSIWSDTSWLLTSQDFNTLNKYRRVAVLFGRSDICVDQYVYRAVIFQREFSFKIRMLRAGSTM